MALSPQKGPDQALFKEIPHGEKERDEDQRKKQGIPFRGREQDECKQPPEHQKLPMGKIENIGNPKDQGETKSGQGIGPSLEGSDNEQLDDKRSHRKTA
jgi:hypothetical protein